MSCRVDKSYGYNAIGSSTERMLTSGIPNSDMGRNNIVNDIGDGNTNSDFSNGSSSNIESMKIRRENVLSELVETESRYVIDLKEVLVNYRDKLAVSNLTETRQRANTIFGNLGKVTKHDWYSFRITP